ncbi:MAG: hypothetical protein KatS3mg126_0437 [Lysobacteraceae bacterium]|nr:MAG: hypothetical protein KatS3mg126_0437 [Xanthomonadaceae bacterium]
MPFDGAPFNLFERPFEVGLIQTAHGDFAFDRRRLLRRLPGTDDWQLVGLGGPVARGFSGIRVDADGKLRLTTWGGVLQYDPNVPEPALVPLAVKLDGWTLHRAGEPDLRLPLQPGLAPTLHPGDRLSFEAAMPSLGGGVELRYRIDGLESAWSAWQPPGRPLLTLHLAAPGDYSLRVEGRTRNGRLGTPLRFDFRVAPAWWQTPWARLAQVLAALLLVLLAAQWISRWRYRHYLQRNRLLEQRITERTAELEAANRKLAELATEDSLTGVANRRALEQALNREWERCAELGQPLAMAMIDVDHFKRFNDTHGHLEGDRQLVRVARTLAERVRPVRELLARYGGEEFAVILPGADVAEAVTRAEAMRAAFDHPDSATTVSIGVAAEVPGPGRSPADLMRAADQALYAAKRRGRNRVVAATE